MAALTKPIQLDLFINEQRELENKVKRESDETMKRQIRLVLHRLYEAERYILKQQETIDFITEMMHKISMEKTP